MAILSGCGGSRVAAPIADNPPAPAPPGPPERLTESVFAIVPNGRTLIASIFEGLARSTDAGESWTIVNPNYAIDFEVGGAQLYAATVNGLLRSSDDGLTWQSILPAPDRSVVMGVSVEGSTLAAVTYTDGRVHVSADLGSTWQSSQLPFTARAQSVLVSGGVVYAGSNPGYVFRSSDGGQTWTPQQTGTFGGSVRTLTAHHGKLFAGVSLPLTVLVSEDGGVNWELRQEGLPTGYAGRWLYSIASRGADLYAGTAGGIYRSPDDGATWTRLPLDSAPQLQVLASAELGGSLYAGTLSYGVHRSDDNGATWARLNDVGTKGDPVLTLDEPALP